MGKKVGGIAKKAAPFAIGGPIGGLAFNQLGGMGGVKDLLFGKDVGPDAEADIAKQQMRNIVESQRRGIATQGLGLDILNKEAETPVEQIARAQVGREQQGIASSAEDARRKLQETIARRGLKGSSVGMAQEVGLNRQAAEQQASLGASLPERISNERRLRAQALLSGGGGVIGAGSESNIPINFRGGRSGGISELLGAGLGGAFGGPGGAQMGAGAGGLARGAFG